MPVPPLSNGGCFVVLERRARGGGGKEGREVYGRKNCSMCVCDRGIDKEGKSGRRGFMSGLCSAAAAAGGKKSIISARWLPNESSLNYQPS